MYVFNKSKVISRTPTVQKLLGEMHFPLFFTLKIKYLINKANCPVYMRPLKIHACNLKRPGKAETNIEGSDVRDFILATGHTAVR